MADEKLRILKMIEEGKLTAREGLELIESLEEDAAENDLSREKPAKGKSRKLRIRITDTKTGQVKVNIAVPAGMVKKLPGMIPQEARAAAEGIDFDAILDGLATDAFTENIIDITDSEDGEHVEIFFE